jgi:hypothetical protein
VLNLANNPIIQEFLDNLLRGYAYRFAEKHNLTADCLPLTFGGFYQKPIQCGKIHGEMGNCCLEKEQVSISLNYIFLFNKLDHERYLVDPENYLGIKFTDLIHTCSHELAHYFQFSKYGRSSCESSGAKDNNGNFWYPELVAEHSQFTREIREMIINSEEYPKLEKC